MNKALLYKARVSDALPADGQGLIYRESSGLYGPEDISGGGGSSRIFNEKLLTADDITAGFKDMVDPFPEWVKESDDAGYGGTSIFGKVVFFNNYYWKYGGTTQGGSPTAAIYQSLNGLSWSYDKAGAFGAISGHCVEVFKGSVYLLNTSGRKVWVSSDGSNFSEVTTTGFPSSRLHAASAVFNNKLWIIGGDAGGTDVYSSSDGEEWTLETNAPGWTSRQLHGAVVHNNKLLVLGGLISNADVWETSDGLNWSVVTSSAAWAARTAANAVVSKYGKLWLVAGLGFPSFTYYSDFWVSDDDGASWSQITSGITGGRNGHCMFSAGEFLITIGGQNGGVYLTDLWSLEADSPTINLVPEKVQAHAIIGSRIYADDIWIRPTSQLVYAYDAEIRQWALLTEYSTLFEVETEPASGTVDGDVWIQTSTQDLYVYETDTWVLKYEEITLYEQQGKPVEYQVIALRNQARAAAGAISDFAADGSKIYFSNTDGKTNLSAILIEGNILIAEQLP